MGRADSVKAEDYFRAAPATAVGATTYGNTVSLAGNCAWSLSVYTNDGAKANVVVQFSDFTNRSRLILPDNLNNMMSSEVTVTVNGTAGTPSFQRVGRYEDPTCSAAVMRVIFTPTTGSTGTIWASLTLHGA